MEIGKSFSHTQKGEQKMTSNYRPVSITSIVCRTMAQWITWLTRDRCNPKFPSSIPAGGKDFP